MKRRSAYLTLIGLLATMLHAIGQPQPKAMPTINPVAHVVFEGDTLFRIHSNLGPYTASERAEAVSERLDVLAQDDNFNPDSLIVSQNFNTIDILYKSTCLTSITAEDAMNQGKSATEVTDEILAIFKKKLHHESRISSIWRTAKEIGLTLLVLLVFYFLIKYVGKLFRFFRLKIIGAKDKFIKGINFKNYEFMTAARELELVLWVLNVVKWITIILIIYAALPILFSIFPATKGIAETLFGYVWKPFRNIFTSFFNYVPNLVAIAVIMFITNYLIKFLKFISSEIQQEKLVLPGFYPDWAKPTFNIFRFLLYAFALVIIFPYLPGSDSPIFKGVSVFLGLLVSLGSSSAISNLIAGLVITYMRAFKIGDRVKIGETVGDVLEKTALVTRIRTIKNETITIPNSSILTGHTINYSSSVKRYELILHTTITLGYDVPWTKAHELLIEAAKKTKLLMSEPSPFVLQTSLDDFYVSYQLNAYTETPKKSAAIYSELHQHIQDIFNEHNIEIMSPHYRANRDGDPPAMPPTTNQPPSFKENKGEH